MKKIILINIFIITFISFSFAQNATVEKGKKYFDFYNYYKTIEKFEVLTDKTTEIKRDLAYSYFNTGQYDKAESYFSQIVEVENADTEDIFTYVKILMINQKYDVAEKWMEKFKTLEPNDVRAELFSSNKGIYNDLSKDKGYFKIKNLDFNSDAQEFSPTFYKDKVVFSSSRKDIESVKRRWTWNNKPFLDFLVADYDTANYELLKLKKFNFNKKYHEGTVTFSTDYNYMIFTSNNYKQKSKDGVHKLELYESKFEKNKWKKPVAFPYNNAEYSVGHPSISADGKILYFASDMPGGVGGVDLYLCTKNENGTWASPVNLGTEINTEGNEMFPFIHQNGYLFFATDGRPGLGGLDLYVAKVEGIKYTNIQNLGTPVNTNFDDFALVFDEKMTDGYFCSNRPSGKGDDDIYSVKLLVPFFSTIILKGITVDNQANILTNVDVNLYDDQKNIIASAKSNYEGKFTFNVERSKNYNVDGKKEKYKGDDNDVSTFGTQVVYETKLILTPAPEFNLIGVVKDNKTKEPIDSVSVMLTLTSTKNNFPKTTDLKGEFTDDLDYVKLNDKLTYTISISKKGYLPFNRDFDILYDHEGQYNINDYLDIELQKIDIGLDISKALQVNPIYFDLNKYNIRPDAAIELDKIVKVMTEYPSLELELGSHTDFRGSDESNKTLSHNRATSSAKYIKDRITNPERIYGKGYGESTPFTVNEETHSKYDFLPVGQVLTEKYIYTLPKAQQEIAHQLNRRTEFKIIKY